jgi:hypothetical protein
MDIAKSRIAYKAIVAVIKNAIFNNVHHARKLVSCSIDMVFVPRFDFTQVIYRIAELEQIIQEVI